MSVLPSLAADAMHFQVSVASDSQVMVKLPKMAMARKNRSALSVVLKRANHIVPASVQELFDGVFSIQLPPRDAYGDIEVNLTMSKPDLSETLTVSFGDQSMLQYQPVQRALDLIQKQFQVLAALPRTLQSDSAGAAMQDFAVGAQRLTREWRESTQELWSKYPEWMQSTRVKSSVLQSRISESSHALYANVLGLVEEGTIHGRRFLGQLSDSSSKAQVVVSRLFESIDMPGRTLRVDTATVVDKLGRAQERAQQIISHAAARLKSGAERR
jgi:hypothetical protein